jgi:2-polyprenyl-3-methyl-5-hydroxy-6-metoxy-1,4-benzoquinol methylase
MGIVEDLYKKKQKQLFQSIDVDHFKTSTEYERYACLISDYHRVLDVACGNGAFMWTLSLQGHECVGVDISDSMVERTAALGFETRKINVEQDCLPIDLGRFDAITALHVLEHLYDPLEALRKNILPRLTSGGRFLCVIPNAVYLKYRLNILIGTVPSFGAQEYGEWRRPYNLTHKTLFTMQGVKDTLTIAGLKNVHVSGVTGSVPGGFLDRLKKHLGNPSITCAAILGWGDKV